MQLPERRHVVFAVRRAEEVGLPPGRPALRHLADQGAVESARLGEAYALVSLLEQPESRLEHRAGSARIDRRRLAGHHGRDAIEDGAPRVPASTGAALKPALQRLGQRRRHGLLVIEPDEVLARQHVPDEELHVVATQAQRLLAFPSHPFKRRLGRLGALAVPLADYRNRVPQLPLGQLDRHQAAAWSSLSFETAPQQRLYLRPLPHQHGSLRPGGQRCSEMARRSSACM